MTRRKVCNALQTSHPLIVDLDGARRAAEEARRRYALGEEGAATVSRATLAAEYALQACVDAGLLTRTRADADATYRPWAQPDDDLPPAA